METSVQLPRFQSTLPRGERPHLMVATFSVVLDFNPRSREGSDGRNCGLPCFTHISIHAPARGATSFGSCYFNQYLDFNPRSREGSDSGIAMEMSYSTTFQSTLPRGERLYTIIEINKQGGFQSTLPRGERLMCFGSAGT